MFPLFTLFYYLLLFFTKFYLRIWNGADRIILVEGCGKEREDTLFFQSYRFVQQRTVAYRGLGARLRGGKGREKPEDCEKAVFSFCSGKEKQKKEKH